MDKGAIIMKRIIFKLLTKQSQLTKNWMPYNNANTLSDIKMPIREQIQVPVRDWK